MTAGRSLALAAAATVLSLSLAGGPVGGQASSTTFGDRVDVDLVTVDVWVTDAAGRPVTGLTADDFEVRHDGVPVTLSHFTEIRDAVALPAAGSAVAAAAAADDPPASRPAPPSHLVLYLDESRLHPARLPQVVAELERLLDSGIVDPARVLIVRQGRRLTVAAPFGSTPRQLRAAVSALAADRTGAAGASLENEAALAIDAIDEAWRQAQDVAASGASGLTLVPTEGDLAGGGGGGGGGAGGASPRNRVGGVGTGAGPEACGMFVQQVRPTLEAWKRANERGVELTASNLHDLVGFLAGLPGVKFLVYLSEGLESRPGSALFAYANSLCPAAGADLLGGSEWGDASRRLTDLTRHANTHRVTLYAIQASGLTPPGIGDAATAGGARDVARPRSTTTFDAAQRGERRDGLRFVAEETGGRALFDRNDLGAALQEIARAANSYYALAYEPPPAEGGRDRRSHAIEVEVDDDRLVARYRRGFQRQTPEQWLAERVEGALNLGLTSNPLAVRLGAGAAVADPESGLVRLPFSVMVPAERLTFLPTDGGEWIAEVSVSVMARQVDADTLALRDESFRLRGGPSASGTVQLPLALELQPGAYWTAVGVRDDGSGEASFVSTLVEATVEP